jgi:Tol biopolymer transport system component
MLNGGAAGADTARSNGKIAFTQNPPGKDHPSGFTIDPTGSHKHRVGPKGTTECTTWAPDGSKILCNDWRLPRVQPATANPDGSDFTRVNPSLPLDLFCTHWSPEDDRLLCHSEGNPNRTDAGLWTVRSSDGGDLQRVTTQPRGANDAAHGYSPDGTRILFSRFRSENAPGVLFSVNPDGSGKVRLTPPGLGVPDFGGLHIAASWAPDSARVTFVGQDLSTSESALYVENQDGTQRHQISPPGRQVLSAQWAPNGELIAFTGCCTLGTVQAWVIRPDGTGLFKVTSPTGHTISLGPAWSPDGRKLLFVRIDTRTGDRGFWTVKANGTALSEVTPFPTQLEYSWGTAPLG